MRMGCHKDRLIDSVAAADLTLFNIPDSYDWYLDTSPFANIQSRSSVKAILDFLKSRVKPGVHLLFMSNGSFDNIHNRVLEQLKQQQCLSRQREVS